jgi:hypothetical protein
MLALVKLLIGLSCLLMLRAGHQVEAETSWKMGGRAELPYAARDTTTLPAGSAGPCVANPDTLDGQKVFLFTETMAMFPGGESAYMEYISKHLKYPCQQKLFQSSVFVTFVVDTQGRIRNPCIYRKSRRDELTSLEMEVLDLIKSMPPWVPGEQDGKKVYLRVYLPIRLEPQ